MDYPAVRRQPFPGDDGALFLSIWGAWTIINTPVDALPDLSDVQVIIKTSYPGQAPDS
jgi:Cu(I)/Ag(I) efflux system membrane protein CusA/SilA